MKFNELKPWQRKKLFISMGLILLIGVSFLFFTISSIVEDKNVEVRDWNNIIEHSDAADEMLKKYEPEATKVTVGTYVENLKEIALKGSYFRVTFQAWFSWEGDDELDMINNFRVYKGYINKMETIKEVHEGNKHYQLVMCDASITKNFWTRRFPLDSHQLKFYIASEYPVNRVQFVPDTENSTLNGNLSIAGYKIIDHQTGIFTMVYDNDHGDPSNKDGKVVTSEFMTAIHINRDGLGLYAKCFIALIGTITWVLIVLFLCTYHHVDPLGMIPAALFGTVSNIMVGANLLPDALQMGLLEYVNIWGIMTIIAVTLSVININRIRNKYEDREFSKLYGQFMFYTIVVLTVSGNILLPSLAIMRW